MAEQEGNTPRAGFSCPLLRLNKPLRAVIIGVVVLALAGAVWGLVGLTRPDPLPKLVYFSAPACSACEQVRPFIDQIKEEYAGLIDVEYVSMTNREKMAYYNEIQPIYLVPAILLFDAQGELVWSGGATVSYNQIVTEIKNGAGVAHP